MSSCLRVVRGAGIVKLDKMTGKTVWTSKELSDTAGYSSITVADVQGVRTYMTFTADAGVGVRASDGKLMFRYTEGRERGGEHRDACLLRMTKCSSPPGTAPAAGCSL